MEEELSRESASFSATKTPGCVNRNKNNHLPKLGTGNRPNRYPLGKFQARKSTKINFLGPETARWGGTQALAKIVVKSEVQVGVVRDCEQQISTKARLFRGLRVKMLACLTAQNSMFGMKGGGFSQLGPGEFRNQGLVGKDPGNALRVCPRIPLKNSAGNPPNLSFKAFEASRAFPEFSPPQYDWGRLFFQKWFWRGPLWPTNRTDQKTSK